MCGPANGINFACVRSMGYLLLVTSTLTIALTIADILVTYFYCTGSGADCSVEPYVWTWVASGIWASIFVFTLGLWAIGWSLTMQRPGWFHDWFLNAVFFLLVPLMISLTIVEVVKNASNRMWFNEKYDKLPIPITIIVLGFLELGICFFIYNEIFCKERSDEYGDVIEYVEEVEPTQPSVATTHATTTPVAKVVMATNYPANVVYPNVAYASRIRNAMVPAYGIYSPKNVSVVQPQLSRWNQPALYYAPRPTLGVRA